MTFAFGSSLAASGPEQARQLGLQVDRVDQQDRQDETRGKEAVDAPEVEAEIEPGHVEDRRQRDVEKPGAHHDHQPDVEHRVLTAEPQCHERHQAQAPHGRYDDDHRPGVVAPAQQHREEIMPGSNDP